MKKNYWIGVIGTASTFARFADANYWFCMPNDAQLGDYVLMYVSAKIAKKNSGIVIQLEILEIDETKNGYCKSYGLDQKLNYVNLKHIKFFTNPISFKDIKTNPMLANQQFMRRKMQGTCFKITEFDFKNILALNKDNK
jgi:predicted RNA-binding protein with PUA-like domain